MKQTMNVLACVAYPLGGITPSYRVGIERWQPYLAQQGINITYLCYTSPQLRAIKYQPGHYSRKIIAVLLNEIRFRHKVQQVCFADFAVAIVLREATLVGPPWLERRLKHAGLPYIYHIDDPIFLPTQSRYTPLFSAARWPKKIAELCRDSAYVVAVNTTIERYVHLLNPNCAVVPLGMLVDSTPTKHTYVLGQPPVIGWIGSAATCWYLSEIREALQRIQQEYQCIIRVIGAAPDFRLPGVHLDLVAWDGATEDERIRGFDVGINPTRIDQWAMGKGSTKTLQYFVNGVPCVASPTGSNIEIIRHGHNALLANTQDKWYDALKKIFDHQSLRQQYGQAGRHEVEQRYNSATHATIIGDIMRFVAAKKNVCAE